MIKRGVDEMRGVANLPRRFWSKDREESNMLSTDTLEELDLSIAPEFARPLETENDETGENADTDRENSSSPAWEELYGNDVLTIIADGRKSSDDDDDGEDEFDEFDDDIEEDDDFEDEDFDDDENEIDGDFDDLDLDEGDEEDDEL